MKIVNYSDFRAGLKNYLDTVIADHDTIFVPRGSGEESVVVMSLAEYNSIKETLHLLRSSKNRARLQDAIERTEKGEFEKHDLTE